MTDFTPLLQPDRGQPADAIDLVDKTGAEEWLKRQSASRRALLEAAAFDGKPPSQFVVLPGGGEDDFEVAATVADAAQLGPWCLARLAEALPAVTYRLD